LAQASEKRLRWLSLNADALLLDERKGRREALVRGVTVSGTLNVLEQAAERGLVDLPKAFGALLQTNFRASTEIIQAMLQRDANRKLSTAQEQDAN
jgi:predicted nucleic acid-binding protein